MDRRDGSVEAADVSDLEKLRCITFALSRVIKCYINICILILFIIKMFRRQLFDLKTKIDSGSISGVELMRSKFKMKNLQKEVEILEVIVLSNFIAVNSVILFVLQSQKRACVEESGEASKGVS